MTKFMHESAQYRIWFGWHGLVWASSVPMCVIVAPATLTAHDVRGILGGRYHIQCSWLKIGNFEEMWHEIHPDMYGKPGFEFDLLRVIGTPNAE
jgi:hypothetical protein